MSLLHNSFLSVQQLNELLIAEHQKLPVAIVQNKPTGIAPIEEMLMFSQSFKQVDTEDQSTPNVQPVLDKIYLFPSRPLLMPGDFDGQQYKILLDSGSNLSTIPKALLGNRAHTPVADMCFKAANNTPSAIEGEWGE